MCNLIPLSQTPIDISGKLPAAEEEEEVSSSSDEEPPPPPKKPAKEKEPKKVLFLFDFPFY